MHILIVEHDAERRGRMEAALAGANHHTEIVALASAALAALARPAPPDLLVVAEALPDMAPLDFLEAASAVGALPPVVLVGEDVRAANWVEAARLGAVDFVAVDGDETWLSLLTGRVAATRERSGSVDRARRMADALLSTSAAVVIASRAGVVEFANAGCARLLGCEAGELPDELPALFAADDETGAHRELLEAVRLGEEWAGEVDVRALDGPPVPTIVTASPIRRGGDGRADGMVLMLRDVRDRVAMEDALRAANRQLAEQAARDPLTGLYNRSYLHEVLDREMSRALRYGGVLTVLMIDLDAFKRVNDEYGHPAGDVVLREVAAHLRPVLRDGDVLARYGGDEFCAVLPNTDTDAASVVGERLRAAVAERGYGPGERTQVRVSVGMATSAEVPAGEAKPVDRLLQRADEALYESKGGGGDRVSLWATG